MKQNDELVNVVNEKRNLWVWIKIYKKELIVAGISISVILGIIVGIKNKESLMALWECLKKSVEKAPVANQTTEKIVNKTTSVADIIELPSSKVFSDEFNVREHIRNLPQGQYASPEKISSSLEHGYELMPGQTWVNNYTKRSCVS